jgi:citrate synthase
MSTWLDAREAATRLGVKPATLYAYASRGQLRRRSAADGRRSEYLAADVAELAVRGRRARPVRPSDLVVPTAITELDASGPRYRGRSAVAEAGVSSFEQVAAHLWGADPARPWRARADALNAATSLPVQGEPVARLPGLVAAIRVADPLRDDLTPAAVAATGASLLATLATATSGPVTTSSSTSTPVPPSPTVATSGSARPGSATTSPFAGSSARGAGIAARLGASWSGGTDTGAVALVDAALVLLADHELASSTLAARIAASARADPYAVVLAGMAVVSGARHGAASRPLESALREIAQGASVEAAIAEHALDQGRPVGFGHPLYPDGDPRARRLSELLDASPLGQRAAPFRELLRVAAERGTPPPSIDVALAGVTHAIGAPVGSGELLFTLARTAGWLAHAIEQYAEPQLLRPRAVYVGGPAT